MSEQHTLLAVHSVESIQFSTKPISHNNLDASRGGCAYPHPDTRNNLKLDKSASNWLYKWWRRECQRMKEADRDAKRESQD